MVDVEIDQLKTADWSMVVVDQTAVFLVDCSVLFSSRPKLTDDLLLDNDFLLMTIVSLTKLFPTTNPGTRGFY